ncbi:hypothetical protein [Leekyejoonella antrihumi]|nr:hypothetical protein [Leekyejoonella antrihumi]
MKPSYPLTPIEIFTSWLRPLYIDHEADVGTYTAPNIWVQHR